MFDERTVVAKEMLRSLSSTTSTTSLVCASLQSNNNNNNRNAVGISIKSRNNPKQPSVEEMERAIGAGMFRDRDPSGGAGEKQTLFDFFSDTPMNQPESPLEKKLREAGEWVAGDTEGPSRSAEHEIWMTVCLTILPVWALLLLIAFGTIKLPFDIPGLEDTIM